MQNKITQAEGQEFDLSTSEGGRGYIADLFRTRLKRHDFTAYINERLAADFACAMSGYIETQKKVDSALQRALSVFGADNAEMRDALARANSDRAFWKAEAEMWKGNHGNIVKLAKLLRERPDLPVDRLPAYKHTEELQHEVERYRAYGCTSCDGSGHIHSIIGDYHGPCVSCAAYELEQAQRTVGSLMHERDTLRMKLDAFDYDEEREWGRYVAACAEVGVKAARNEHGSPVEANGIFAGWQGWNACAKLRAKAIAQ